jgi:phage virion morphogenesis protein
MSGVRFEFTVDGLSQLVRAQRRLGRLDEVIDRDLGLALADVLEEQTRRRILEEKRAPDGTPWEAWSTPYARLRGSTVGKDGLVDTHKLEESIKGEAHGKTALVLSDTIYAAVHQFGHHFAHNGARVPARPYLGISTENEAEIQDVLREVLEDALEETFAHTKHGRAIDARGGKKIV